MSSIETIVADYQSQFHRTSILRLLNEYANDPAIGGTGLPFKTRQRVVDELARRDAAVTLLAIEKPADGSARAVGLLNAFETFSTFAAMPVLNLHDIMVTASHRGRGIGRQLIASATRLAIERECCKLTLEVYRGNAGAAGLYRSCGFDDPSGNRDLGETLFLAKVLT